MNRPFYISATEFRAYSAWVKTLWLSVDRPLEQRDIAVMGLGLPGEMGELFEELYSSSRTAGISLDLDKEFGDALYYASRIFTAFELEIPAEGWASDLSAAPAGSDEFRVLVSMAGLKFVISVGRVCEILKKNIRDNSVIEGGLKSVLASNLAEVIQAWLDMVALAGRSPQELISLNQAKVNSRRERGVLRGSGNNR